MNIRAGNRLLFTLCQPLSHMETSSLDTLSLVLGLEVSMCSVALAALVDV